MTQLLQRMHDELVRRNYAATTIRTYLHALNLCRRQHPGRRLDQLGAACSSGDIRPTCSRSGSSPSAPWGCTSRRCASSYVRVLKRRALKEELPHAEAAAPVADGPEP